MKVCPRCGGEKPKSEFGFRCAGEKKLNSWCSACRTDETNARRARGRPFKENEPFYVDPLLDSFIRRHSRKAHYSGKPKSVIRAYEYTGCIEGEVKFGPVVSSVTQRTLKFGHPTCVVKVTE